MMAISDDNEEDLNGKTIVITGSNEGIGAIVTKILANMGARIILLCRDMDKARRIVGDILAENPIAELSIHHIDLSSQSSIRICVNEILQLEKRIDCLINCASVAFIPGIEPTKSIDGFELHMAINYYGPFLLIQLLNERMKQTAKQYETIGKVINVTSILHRYGKIHLADLNLDKSNNYTPFRAYCQSRLALMLVGREMARQWKQSQIHIYNVDPGFSMTRSHYQNLYPICRKILSIFGWLIGFRSNLKAAQRIVQCVIDKKIARHSGYYYRNGRHTIPSERVMDDRLAKNLWTHTITVCNLS
uniref:Retinol dehydrogenase 12-like n=1 Tax=Dermatophagoides pteronyssinus TaxID=6956 RepID=A0A6P6XL68_DERPT|nr:retinol dehydrogenase 12-like [Dermatophagoides pteronyssinus]